MGRGRWAPRSILASPLHASMQARLNEIKDRPSLGLWRAAEVAALREQTYERPILDLGCGDGLVTSLVVQGVEIGLDPDHWAIERANQFGNYGRFEVAPAEKSRLAAGCMGTVLSNSVLEHLPQVDEVLRLVAQSLASRWTVYLYHAHRGVWSLAGVAVAVLRGLAKQAA